MIPGRAAGYALLGFAGLLLVVAVLSGWSGAKRIARDEDAPHPAEQAAAGFVVAYGAFDHRDAVTYTARLAGRATGALRVALLQSTVDPAAFASERTSTTAVEATSLTAHSEFHATVEVQSMHERSWRDASGARVEEHVRQRVLCRLVLEDGRWLIVGLDLLSEEPLLPTGTR